MRFGSLINQGIEMLVTTLNKIKEYNSREVGWETLLRYLEKTKADDDPLAFLTILESNGFDDALWCMRSAPEYEKEWRLFAVWCARQVQHLMTDERSIAALDVAEKYANVDATEDELNSASAEASAAASNAAWAATRAAASNAAWVEVSAAASAAAWVEASAAASAAASNAASNAAWTEASNAASNAAWAAESAAASAAAWVEASNAASAEAWAAVSAEASAAAWAATRAVASAAASAAVKYAASAATSNAAWAEARYAQKQQFIKIISGE